ncbi:MAG TPA: hypothetical protein VII61_07960 [Ktedonobacteraceae bacterium]
MDEMDRGRSRPQGSRPRPTRDLDEYEYERRPRRRRPPPDERLPRRRRRRRVWPLLLAGCGLGVFLTVLAAAIIVFLAIRTTQGNSFGSLPIIGGAKTYTKEDITQVQLSTISQIQVCDKIGNVSIQVDPTASTPAVTTTKIVHMNSQTAADQEFQRIGVEVQPPGTITDPLTCTQSQPTTVPTGTPPTSTSTGTPPSTTNGSASSALTVNITLPTSNGLLQADSDAVNIAIILPLSVLPPDGPTMQLDVEAPVGNISIDGISGLMNVIGDKGNIQVKNGVLTGGSQLVTDLGNITFSGTLGSPTIATAQNNFYHISSGQGNIDVTLPATTNVTLDTYTNQGKISSEFTIPLQDSNGGMAYQGPLNTASSPTPDITLVVHMNLGNITIHKQQ